MWGTHGMRQNKPYLVGLTGGIATGKSTAANYIKLNGYSVIEFDKINHDLITNDSISKSELEAFFGPEIVDGEGNIIKSKLGDIVFNDKDKLHILNGIMHPKIYRRSMLMLEDLKDEDIVFLDIPLLFETKELIDLYKLKFNETWVISAKEDVQVSRLMIRNNIDINSAKNLIKTQMNIKVKEKLADVVIFNNYDIENLYDELRIELNNLRRRVSIYEEK